jgi:hypothetical protein
MIPGLSKKQTEVALMFRDLLTKATLPKQTGGAYTLRIQRVCPSKNSEQK